MHCEISMCERLGEFRLHGIDVPCGCEDFNYTVAYSAAYLKKTTVFQSILARITVAQKSIDNQDTKRRNALSMAMVDQLHKELREIDKIQKVRRVNFSSFAPFQSIACLCRLGLSIVEK